MKWMGLHSTKLDTHRTLSVMLLSLAALVNNASAQEPPQMDPISFEAPNPEIQYSDITIEQNLEAQIDMSLTFTNSDGKEVALSELMDDRPAILAFVYYDCPSMCKAELAGLEIVVKGMKYVPGDDYNVITVSIDPNDTYQAAREKKAYHVGRVARDGADKGWKFLTGTEENIQALAKTVGFVYRYDANQDIYAHAGGIMILTPAGVVSRYYYGTEYIKRDVEFGLMEASEGRIGKLVDKVLVLCFKYDPAAGKYGLLVFRLLKVVSTLLILGLASMYYILYLRTRKKNEVASAGPISDGTQGVVN